MRQLHRVVAKGPVDLGQFGLGIVRLDLFDPLVVVDLGPEVIGMSLRSVMATVGLGHHDGQHLALGPRQRGVAVHDDLG